MAPAANSTSRATDLLCYRAGPSALRLLRAEGLDVGQVRAVVGPASGPKWLVLAGIDRALLERGLAETTDGERRLLVGASAGAWRMLAFAARDPAATHRALLDGYVHQVFPRGVTPAVVGEAYRRMLDGLFGGEARRIVEHDGFDLAVHVTRVRGARSWRRRSVQMATLTLAALLNGVSRGGTRLVFERVLLHTRPEHFRPSFAGTVVALDRGNLLPAVLASGSVPLFMPPVRGIPGAPRGAYVDGGMTDYHLRQRYVDGDRGLILFPHFRRRIAPVWFDRWHARRRPAPDALQNVLQIYPSARFVAQLPEGRLPDRDDFFRFVDAPEERIRRWHEAAALSERLGQALLQDLDAGRIADRVEPL